MLLLVAEGEDSARDDHRQTQNRGDYAQKLARFSSGVLVPVDSQRTKVRSWRI
jgi:hypothetical protein